MEADAWNRFIDCEKWRKDFGGGVDKLVPTFDYKEKAEVFKYYPQYYHKTDKVCGSSIVAQFGPIVESRIVQQTRTNICAGWSTTLH